MKKSFLLFTMLLLLLVSVVFLGQYVLLSQKDEVNITEHILFGDASVVEGVTLELNNHYENQMFWTTEYRLGKEHETETDYTFYQTRQYTYEEMDTNSLTFNEKNYMDWLWFENEEPQGIEKAFFELYDSLAPYELGEKTIYIKDYMDYYTFTLDFDEGQTWNLYLDTETLRSDILYAKKYESDTSELEKQEKWLQTFQAFFKIPVLESQICNIAMQKDKDGEISGWTLSQVNGATCMGDIDFAESPDLEVYDAFSFDIVSSVEDGEAYFTFYSKSFQGVPMDMSLIPDGYGIYYFPYDKEKEELYPEQLQMVYALDPNVEVYDLTRDDSGKYLLLFTTEEDGVYLSVIEIATMILKDKVLIDGAGYDDEFYGIDYYTVLENYIVVLTYDDFVLLTQEANGNYKKEFSILRSTVENFNSDSSGNTMVFALDTAYAWDGERLIFANHFYNGNGYNGTNFYVGAVSKEGLLYFAEYETSLSSTVSKDENGHDIYDYAHCRPVENGMHINITERP